MTPFDFNPPLPDHESAPTPEFFKKMKQLHFLGLDLSRAQKVDELCEQAIVQGRAVLNIDRMGLFLVSEDRHHFLGTFGTDQDGVVRDERDYVGDVADDPFMRELLDSGQRTVYRIDAPLLDYRAEIGTGWNAMTGMWDGDTLIGIIASDNLMSRTPLTTITLELMNVFAETVAHLIVRKRTEQALREAEESNRIFVERLRHLHEVTMELSLIDNLDTLYRRAVELARERLGFDRIGLFRFDDTTQELVGTYGTDGNGQLRDESHFRQNIRFSPRLVEVIESRAFGKYWLDTDLKDMGGTIGTGWNAMAMLWDGDRGIGWIACDNLMKHEPFHPYQFELLTLYGSTLGHLIARRNAEELRVELAIDHEKLGMLRTFVSNITHDFKTPLAVLNTSLYLLRHTTDPDKQRQRFEIMQRHIDFLNRLIQDLLMISRLEHLTTFSISEISVNQLIEQVLVRLQTEMEHKELHVVDQLAPTLPLIQGSQQELFRALTNLIENAISFSHVGGTITISTSADDEAVYLEVNDMGMGISAEDLEQIFDHYYRGDVANTYAQTGTGLGLAIVKRVVDLHGGTISVHSEIGLGSTFQISLPIRKQLA